MENIWGLILQTVTVSVTALVLLLIKWLMADKLSPRWQYSVWSVLAIRILVPVSTGRELLHSLLFRIELWKDQVEIGLNSAYSAVYHMITVDTVLPWIKRAPISVTDWLFCVYAAGVVGSTVYYVWKYLQLRRLLARGERVSPSARASIDRVCNRYGLRKCGMVSLEGVTSAFVCGVFRPIMVIPADTEPDEKILLHELLHVKYKDSLQSIFWCGLRCLHWFNPLMQYVFDRIGNDMESRCDQRVLELLEGEERREYGVILLQMANDRYARVPGTTSVSNGGQNISRRIKAIVRFKKYPKGMELVSLCCIICIMHPIMTGNAATYEKTYSPWQEEELAEAMVMARMNRCSTKAGALDTFAKALMFENGIYMAMVSPMDDHAELVERMINETETKGEWICHLDSGPELTYVDQSQHYGLFNLQPCGEEEYTGIVAIAVRGFPDEAGTGDLRDETGEEISHGTVLIPVKLWKEDGWLVEEIGEREICLSSSGIYQLVKPMRVLTGQSTLGPMSIGIVREYSVKETTETSSSDKDIGSVMGLTEPITDAEFGDGMRVSTLTLDMRGGSFSEIMAEAPKGKIAWEIGFMVVSPMTADTEVVFPADWHGGLSNHDKMEENGEVRENIEGETELSIRMFGGIYRIGDTILPVKEQCEIGIYIDGELLEVVQMTKR